MAEVKDIAEQVTALTFAALALVLPEAAVLAPAAISFATLAAMGRSLRRDAPEATALREATAALDGMVRAGEFNRGQADRALALLGSGERAVRLSPQVIVAAAREADFDGALAAQLADAAVGADDPEMRGPLLVAFRASLSVLRTDVSLRGALTVGLLLQAARDNGTQLDLLTDIQRELQDLRESYGSLAASLDDVRRLSRADKLALAGQFERADATMLTDPELQVFLENKAEEWRAYRARIEAIDDSTAGLGNLKAAARDAAARLDFDEVEALLSQVDEVETEIAAESKVLRADNALLRGRVEEAFRMLSAAADSFRSVSLRLSSQRRTEYSDILRRYGERYGSIALLHTTTMLEDALNDVEDNDIGALAFVREKLGQVLTFRARREQREVAKHLSEKAVDNLRYARKVWGESCEKDRWLSTANGLANALTSLAETSNGNWQDAIFEAVKIYGEVIAEMASNPSDDLATAYTMRGSALQTLAVRSGGYRPSYIWDAVESFEKALSIRDPNSVPLEWALTQNNLGNAYLYIGQFVDTENDGKYTKMAMEAYSSALRFRTEGEHPMAWAMTMLNRGLAFEGLAAFEETAERMANLRNAEADFLAALRVFTAEHAADLRLRAESRLDVVRRRLQQLQ